MKFKKNKGDFMNKKFFIVLSFLLCSAKIGAVLFPGDLDPTFNPTGNPKGTESITIGSNSVSTSVAIDPNRQIVLAGYALIGTQTQFAVARLNVSDGSLDTSFNSTGTQTTLIGLSCQGNSVAVDQGPGNIFVAGFALTGTTNKFALASYSSVGSLSWTTTTTIIEDVDAKGNSVATDGSSIFVAGYSKIGGKNRFAVAKFGTSGALSWVTTTTIVGVDEDAKANSVAIYFGRGTPKIVVAGYATVGGVKKFALARFDFFTGSLDKTSGFGAGGVGTEAISIPSYTDAIGASLAINQSLGDIYVSGSAGSGANPQSAFALAQFKENAALLATTTTSIGSTFSIGNSVAIDQVTRDKIVVAGYADPGGSPRFVVARYDLDKILLDTSFGSPLGYVSTQIDPSSTTAGGNGVAIQDDQKIVVSGFANFPGNKFGAARFIGKDPLKTIARYASLLLWRLY
jgi:uncharacterized delta-60 repeat protein